MGQQTTDIVMAPATQRAVVAFDELWGMAEAVSKSKLFAVKSTEEAVTLMMLAQAEGVHPIQAMRMYHVINNRPSMRADAMQAKFQQRGGRIKWLKRTDDCVTAEFSHPELQPDPITITWDNDRVKKAQLMKDNHLKFPLQMKASRVISEGVGAIMPEVKMGLYTPEEVEGMQEPTPPRQTMRVVEATVVEPTLADDSHFLAEWDRVTTSHGIDQAVGRNVVLNGKLKKKGVAFADANPEARRTLLDEYRAATPEQIEQIKKLTTKPKTDDAATPALADAWRPFEWKAKEIADGAGIGADVFAVAMDVVSESFGVPTNMIPADQLAEVEIAMREGRFDWSTGKVATNKKATAA